MYVHEVCVWLDTQETPHSGWGRLFYTEIHNYEQWIHDDGQWRSLVEYKAMNVERQCRIFVKPWSDKIHMKDGNEECAMCQLQYEWHLAHSALHCITDIVVPSFGKTIKHLEQCYHLLEYLCVSGSVLTIFCVKKPKLKKWLLTYVGSSTEIATIK